MSVINTVIPTRAFQRIRDRIGAILFDELDNQAQLTYDETLEAGVWVERTVQFDHTKIPAVNVMLQKGTFGGQDQKHTEGTYTFCIDCYTKAPSSDTVDGDSEAVLRLHRLLGVCQAILEDSRYKTLGFTAPFIWNRRVDELIIAEPAQKQDLYSIAYGRLIFSVKASETNATIDVTLLKSHYTAVKLSSTDEGYQYNYSSDQNNAFDVTFDQYFDRIQG